MEIISENVKKTYKIKNKLFKHTNLEVVKDFSYSIKQGEIIALMGKLYSGKSTIINLLSGRVLPTSGKIYVDGEIDYKKLKNNCEIITSLNSRKLLDNETVYNNLVSFGLKLKINSLDIEKKIVELRDILELDKSINKKINCLDTFEKAKLNVAISMLNSPSILFFDEALVNFDAITKNLILKLLKRLNKELKTTIVIACVDLIDIEKICKRISIIQDGKILADSDYDTIKQRYWREKIISIIFNKSFNIPRGDFTIIENSDYNLKIKVDFTKCDFATLINQFDINSILDINISNLPLNTF